MLLPNNRVNHLVDWELVAQHPSFGSVGYFLFAVTDNFSNHKTAKMPVLQLLKLLFD